MSDPDWKAKYLDLRKVVRGWVYAEYNFRCASAYRSLLAQDEFCVAERKLRAEALRGLKDDEARARVKQGEVWLAEAARLLGFRLAPRFHATAEDEVDPEAFMFPSKNRPPPVPPVKEAAPAPSKKGSSPLKKKRPKLKRRTKGFL